ncbi:MAG: type IX secretion system outer membrane channel protein PorV [Bacteroidetes bacterium]|nr:type IX secretion system outer membrane channel protein PorV [Bacteroidota bacterium]
MGKQKIFFTLSLATLGASFTNTHAQITTNQLTGGVNTITTAVPFLLISPDSRGGGMADIGAASSPDANSIHWNASKLAFSEKKFGLGMSYTPWLRNLVPDINLAYLSGYYKVKEDQAIGASLRYFSLGDITFTDVVGNTIGQFKPNEFAFDVAYARRFSPNWSGGMAMRYIYSNLTGGINVQGSATKAGKSVAADVNAYYTNSDIKVGGKKSTVAAGLNISNIGAKISYTTKTDRDFIPINMRLGGRLTINLDDYNSFSVLADLNKLLVPTPPVYDVDSAGQIINNPDGSAKILKGEDPNRGIAEGIFGSFNDAPGGFKEEMKEVNYSIGLEYWYDNQFAVRAGYFNEDETKGNRKYFTFGLGVKYNVFGLDFAYLVPTKQRNNPLSNTLRFTLLFDFDAFKGEKEEAPAE